MEDPTLKYLQVLVLTVPKIRPLQAVKFQLLNRNPENLMKYPKTHLPVHLQNEIC
ncbi:hypothetical protein METSMIALI_00408 [Methanobrevibacter smithii DSM 2375]|uniref:Uncharacterized protein n=1 Tax=Methanobrevibacter smithii DSM 2375 TaxID=483214 RepID=B9ADI5_METSM|nr:hypothetical protein METSMIALI_00408 [Methanobrevibacter smithii DSM 2375]